jgi:hypothetical protein
MHDVSVKRMHVVKFIAQALTRSKYVLSHDVRRNEVSLVL